MCLHKLDEEKSVPPQSMLCSWEQPLYTLSQIQYLPETIRRYVANCVDREAEYLLGRSIAESIDLYRLVRESYVECQHELWMPCLGMEVADFSPRDTFPGYNPKHVECWENPPKEYHHIPRTTISWGEISGSIPNEYLYIPHINTGRE